MIKDTPKGLPDSALDFEREPTDVRKRNGGHTRCRKIYGENLS